MNTRKQNILQALDNHVRQRPGLEFGNYGDLSAYRKEYRSIQRDKRDFEALLKAVQRRTSISADDLLKATAAYSGRLTINEDEEQRLTIKYCTGQYWPTEYRRAACAVLASALRGYWRTDLAIGDDVRRQARLEFGSGLANRWFN